MLTDSTTDPSGESPARARPPRPARAPGGGYATLNGRSIAAAAMVVTAVDPLPAEIEEFAGRIVGRSSIRLGERAGGAEELGQLVVIVSTRSPS